MNIKDLAPELQELCHKRQIEQGNDGTFDGELFRDRRDCNFNWHDTEEGDEFWERLNNGDGMRNHPKYPKTGTYELY